MNVYKGGRVMRSLREAKGWTQQETIANLYNMGGMGVMTQKDLSRIESGQVQEPGIEKVMWLGRVYGLSPDEVCKAFDVFPEIG